MDYEPSCRSSVGAWQTNCSALTAGSDLNNEAQFGAMINRSKVEKCSLFKHQQSHYGLRCKDRVKRATTGEAGQAQEMFRAETARTSPLLRILDVHAGGFKGSCPPLMLPYQASVGPLLRCAHRGGSPRRDDKGMMWPWPPGSQAGQIWNAPSRT